MKMKLLTAFSGLLLFGCDLQINSKEFVAENTSINHALEANGDSPGAPVMDEMTSLRGALLTLAAPSGATWDAFENVVGLSWRDPRPVAGNEEYRRTGYLMLVGFDVASIPNGKIGVDADSSEVNEGKTGLTLAGSAAGVHSLAILKFYPNENYEEIIKKQLLGDDHLSLVADRCFFEGALSGENSHKNMFYKVMLLKTGPLYLEAFVDEEGSKYSPGSTTFVFYRDKPIKRIAEMKCREKIENRKSLSN